MSCALPLGIIVARARNGVIGRAGALPWHLPQDLAHFRQVTSGHPVIMGRRTWQSLPPRFRPLPGRRNLVLSTQPGWQAPGAEVYRTLEAACRACRGSTRAWVIGGAQLYAQALPLADTVEITEIDADFDGDTCFPAWEPGLFIEVGRQPHPAGEAGSPAYAFVTYRRAAPALAGACGAPQR